MANFQLRRSTGFWRSHFGSSQPDSSFELVTLIVIITVAGLKSGQKAKSQKGDNGSGARQANNRQKPLSVFHGSIILFVRKHQ